MISALLVSAWVALSPAQSAAPALRTTVAAPAVRREAVILSAVENMYSGPDTARDVVSQALLGQVVGILEEREGFARIETPDRYAGWIPLAALFPYAEAATRYAQRGTVADVTALMANLYREPSVTTARPKAQAPLGTRLEVSATAVLPETAAKRWIAVRLPNGEGAYVQRGDVRMGDAAAAHAPGTGGDLVATVRRFLGVPYLWGGMSPHGVDCSGLVSRVYAANGIALLRDADIQFTDPRARAVERDALQPGDLLFFGERRITHVGMYVADGRFISATTYQSPVVREDSLDDPYWASSYRGARRMPAATSH